MTSATTLLGEFAQQVRSKNAGPFWITLDIFLRTEDDYEWLRKAGPITAATISALYLIPIESVQIFEMPALWAIKISFPRPVTAGSFEDRDQHGGQQYLPLAQLAIPVQQPHG